MGGGNDGHWQAEKPERRSRVTEARSSEDEPEHEHFIMATEPSASIGDDAGATALPPRPSRPGNVSAGSAEETGSRTDVDRSTAAPLVRDAPQRGMTTASTIRALGDDGPPVPLLHVVDHEKETEGAPTRSEDDACATGPPPRPPPPSNVSAEVNGGVMDVDRNTAAPLMQDNLRHCTTSASTVRALSEDDPPLPLLHVVDPDKDREGPQLHDGPPGPPSYPFELDDSLAKKLENDVERQLPNYSDASTVHSTVRPNVADAAAVGPSMVEGVEEGNVSSLGATPSARSHTEAVSTTLHVGLDSPSSGPSPIVVEAYRVEEAEVTPGVETVYAEVAVIPFYQRKGFASVMIAVTLLAMGVAVLAVVVPSNNKGGNIPTIRTNMPTRHQFTTNAELKTAIREYLDQGCPTNANCQAHSTYGGAVSPL